MLTNAHNAQRNWMNSVERIHKSVLWFLPRKKIGCTMILAIDVGMIGSDPCKLLQVPRLQ